MNKKKSFCGIVLLAIILNPGILAMADDTMTQVSSQIGHVVAVRGDVVAKDVNGDARKLSIKSPIYKEDTIETSKRGKVQVIFKDNTIISLGRESIIKIADYDWSPEQKTGEMKTQVKEGVFRVMGGAITKVAPKKFITETPAASIGIRGSMYAGKVVDDSLEVVFLGGTGIDVTNEAGTVALLKPGHGTTVMSSNTIPSPPSEFTKEQMSEINETDVAQSTPEDNTEIISMNSVGSIINDSVNDNSQTSIDQEIEDKPEYEPEEPDLDPTIATLTGSYLNVTSDSDGSNNNYSVVAGDITAISSTPDGEIVGTVTGEVSTQSGTTIPFSFSIPVYNPDADYTGVTEETGLTRVVSLLGVDRDFQTLEVLYSDLGEFAVFTITDGMFNDTSTYNFNELGFAGVASVSAPDSGVDTYTGPYLSVSQGAVGSDLYAASTMEMVVNWGNGKVLGIMSTSGGTPTYFFGDVNGTTLTNIQVIGSKILSGGNAVWKEGEGTFGQFYGTANQGVGFAAETGIYGIGSDMFVSLDERLSIAGGFRDIASQHFSSTALTGTVAWEGFVVGVSENMADPNVNRRIFMNDDISTGFQLTINRDTGVLSGTMSAIDAFYSPSETFEITSLEIGGTHGSAYILDDAMIAILGGTEQVQVTNSTAPYVHTGDLKLYGNYMVTADPDDQFADFAKWGYWEAAYVDPSSGNHYHVKYPGSMWIAGEKTPEAYIDSMIAGNLAATYTGGAQGIHINNSGIAAALTNGVTTLAMDFNASASIPITGTMQFDQVSLGVSNGNINNTGFNASITGASSSTVNGAFYGPNADSIGGNFAAEMSSGNKYLGIFGGNRNL